MTIDCGHCGVVLRRTPGLDVVILRRFDLERDDAGAFLRCPCCGNKERYEGAAGQAVPG